MSRKNSTLGQDCGETFQLSQGYKHESRYTHKVDVVDGQLQVKDSPLVEEALERIKNRKVVDERPPIPPDVLLVKSLRLKSFERDGKLPLDETDGTAPKIDWGRYITLKGLFSLPSWRTRWNALKIGCKKAFAILTGHWP